MKYGSVCSGIEAATVAWSELGWEPAWFSEIEQFPAQVLSHHYPDTPNLGDMTTIAERIRNNEVEAPDILVGGTPCQAFSVAGLRNSLGDDRGQLSLEFVRLANEIDSARFIRGQQPSFIIWENVPGVLNTSDNAFGCFLGALSGTGCELKPAGKKWTNAGCVFGPQRQIVWRVLDAQYFGLAQRRKRVFVVASARKECISEILIERKGMFGDSDSSRGKGENPTSAGKENTDAAGKTSFKEKPLVVVGVGGVAANASISVNVQPTLLANNDRAYVCESYGVNGNVINQLNHGSNGVGCAYERSYTLTSKLNAVIYGIQGCTIGRSFNAGGNGIGFKEELAPTLTSMDRHGVLCGTFNDALRDLSVNIAPTSRAGGKGGGPIRHAVFEPVYSMIADTTPRDSLARYLTEVECERLQGFPDEYTNIPGATKGNRYKALGNSMAVPVMHWIGKRVDDFFKCFMETI